MATVTRLQAEQFKAALQVKGVGEAIVPASVYYYLGNTIERQFHGRDEQGNFIDCGATRIRPLTLVARKEFLTIEEMGAFVDDAMK